MSAAAPLDFMDLNAKLLFAVHHVRMAAIVCATMCVPAQMATLERNVKKVFVIHCV